MLIAQLTDTHVIASGRLLQGRIDTRRALDDAVRHIASLPHQPDLVLLTGDLADEGNVADYESLRDALRCVEAPIAIIPGNHDDRGALASVFPEVVARGGAPFQHYAFERDGRRFIGLDTVRPGEVAGGMCATRLDWLETRLAESTLPTLIFMHHPPFPTGIRFMDEPFVGADVLAGLIEAAPHVRQIVCGHVHRATTVQWAGTQASIGPSTVYQMCLALGAGERFWQTEQPPAIALYQWRDLDQPPIVMFSIIGFGEGSPSRR